MNMFEKIGEFTPDSLIASPDFPILKEGIGLKPGQGVLKRGSLILKGTDKAGYIAGNSAAGEGAQVSGILTDDTDTGDETSEDVPEGNIPATVYQTGVFNRAAVLLSGEDADIGTYEDEMKDVGIYLRDVQKYEGR
ncbi:MAG: hypothetical protein HFH54_01620 [Lachnospiraceae bacterium]|nr:hypothetical protein [Lachnospiraceae bacterium]